MHDQVPTTRARCHRHHQQDLRHRQQPSQAHHSYRSHIEQTNLIEKRTLISLSLWLNLTLHAAETSCAPPLPPTVIIGLTSNFMLMIWSKELRQEDKKRYLIKLYRCRFADNSFNVNLECRKFHREGCYIVSDASNPMKRCLASVELKLQWGR